MDEFGLPERFRAGDFGLSAYEVEVLRGFVDAFFDAAESGGGVSREDFTEFMDFLSVMWEVDSEPAKLIMTHAFMRGALIRNALERARKDGDPRKTDPENDVMKCEILPMTEEEE